MCVQAMQDVFETEKITEMQLTGHHLSSLADLALQQMAQVGCVIERETQREVGGSMCVFWGGWLFVVLE